MTLEKYEPTGQGLELIGPSAALVRLIPDNPEPRKPHEWATNNHLSELAVMKRIYTGLCATWGLNRIPENDDPELIKATIILALSGKFWIGQQFESFMLSFSIKNVSRGCTHQLVRSRFMAFGQEGTRDTDQSYHDTIIPPTIHRDPELDAEWIEVQDFVRAFYDKCMKKGIPFQDASYILPKGTLTDIVAHVNFRALQEFMGARLSNSMHWEINHLAWKMRELVIGRYPTFGLWLLPRCELAGKCLSQGTLFGPCGKLPLREGQSDEVNRFGKEYRHSNDDNPNADPFRIKSQLARYGDESEKREKLVEWAEEVYDDRA